ncbi:hypothetical protein INR49_006035 [Caranx melampygus]|nr:hypothetical protein INR49_006035 [Caranx melampygus]
MLATKNGSQHTVKVPMMIPKVLRALCSLTSISRDGLRFTLLVLAALLQPLEPLEPTHADGRILLMLPKIVLALITPWLKPGGGVANNVSIIPYDGSGNSPLAERLIKTGRRGKEWLQCQREEGRSTGGWRQTQTHRQRERRALVQLSSGPVGISDYSQCQQRVGLLQPYNVGGFLSPGEDCGEMPNTACGRTGAAVLTLWTRLVFTEELSLGLRKIDGKSLLI